ncbi:MAG: redoxin domain-containing protein [Deltaproteobacteria bacterium]|nr:redoxin domain-containing protein [Deltaproteobacteria bacterium]
MRLPRLLVVATLWGSATVGCHLATEQAPVAPQQRAPDFELRADDGRTVSLTELVADGPAVLVFYRGHW